jgi:hypothetical protein
LAIGTAFPVRPNVRSHRRAPILRTSDALRF